LTEETILLLDQRHQRGAGRDPSGPPVPAPLTPSLLAVPPRGTPPDPLPPELFLSAFPDKQSTASRGRRLRRIALIGCASGLGVLTALLLGYGTSDSSGSDSASIAAGAAGPAAPSATSLRRAAAAPDAPAEPVPVPPAPAAAGAAKLVDLHVESTPSGATVVLDGVRLGKTPFIGRVPHSATTEEAVLKLRRRGYKTMRVPVDPERPVEVRVTLHPENDP
jgi:PEGA domain-containing protein